ncbi:signal peptide protein [Azospirillum thiophilum]|uniref:FHA domain-containing protein n=1 Tax=Azospirillum thiophilum TaxID=528244 RepID=A0AAC8VXT5_9PROT|nr:FHA domain-containing protein [Azospirillum thiophilum]ALG71326.1 hypothetical protein AL072_10870 [Azospirillum thiophilum]KJR65018.1 signal peptide protein [Azospirillum thiophilum]
MKLRLTLIQCPPAQGGDISRDLGTGRLVIGRGPDCDWVLNDTERMLSKIHCMVEFKGGVYIVIDSSTNGVFLNDAPAPIGRGNSAVVGEGDRLRMGGFVMRAGFAADEAPAANDPFLAVLRGSDAPAGPAPAAGAADDPFALPAFGRGPMSVMAIPEDDDLFGGQPEGGESWGRPSGDAPRGFGGWQRTAAGSGGGEDPDWPGSAQPDFAPDSFGTMRVATEREPGAAFQPPPSQPPSSASAIPDDWLDDPVELSPPAASPAAPFGAPDFAQPADAVPQPSPAPAVPPADWGDDWADEPLAPPAFGARAPASATQQSPLQPPPFEPTPFQSPAGSDALTGLLVEVVLSLMRRQAALEARFGLDPEETLAQGGSILRRAADAGEALAGLRALPPAEAEALLRAAATDGEAHQSALLAAVRELTGEVADGDARLAALYRRLLPIHRHALGG